MIVDRIQTRWPDAQIILRADFGIARERIIEQWDVSFVLGPAKNDRLERALTCQVRRAKEWMPTECAFSSPQSRTCSSVSSGVSPCVARLERRLRPARFTRSSSRSERRSGSRSGTCGAECPRPTRTRSASRPSSHELGPVHSLGDEGRIEETSTHTGEVCLEMYSASRLGGIGRNPNANSASLRERAAHDAAPR